MKAIILLLVQQIVHNAAVTESLKNGHSYYQFSGPVSGQVQEIVVYDPHDHKQTFDYVAKPDYSYKFEVEDAHTGNSQQRSESRDGDAVKGEYSLLQADGIVRTVKYSADAINGFQATVHFD